MSDPHPTTLAHHFEDHEQQHEASLIGMWAFIAQEIMFFGGLFAAYALFRNRYHSAFFEGSAHLDVTLGTVNTAVLICSSLTMALAVRCAQLGQHKKIALWVVGTIGLGGVFLGIKAFEYAHKFHEGHVPGLAWHPGADADPNLLTFYGIYFAMTGMHALHMVIGMVIMGVVAFRALRKRCMPENYIGVEVLGLYWHFVDLVWIFLFPLLYLLNRHA